ncbi:MAG TPA: EamA family transporter [Anaerolineae bacterium]|jgi:drug/metabolite transporter (DMT)-like permease
MPPLAIFLILLSTFLHAGWNLVFRNRRSDYAFLDIVIVTSVVGLGPALVAEFGPQPMLVHVGGYLLLAGFFQAVYYLGLTQSYRHGDFTVVYPIARSLPVLLVAVGDVARGRAPSPIGWLGMILVSLGCVFIPLESWRGFSRERFWNRGILWAAVTALGIVGYTLADKIAAEFITPGPWSAARYAVYEAAASAGVYWFILKWFVRPDPRQMTWTDWRWAALAALGVFGAYWLILWSYQLASQASYVVALRQFSIIIGVVLGAIFLREVAPMLRLSAACIIVAGIAGIVLGG